MVLGTNIKTNDSTSEKIMEAFNLNLSRGGFSSVPATNFKMDPRFMHYTQSSKYVNMLTLNHIL